ncbi:hypothetical protein [Erythrobacter sp.]|uniref:hypothetical protein n=1 Tax=Erythrobacter sp. TaxID=1042 RepID=UPI003C71D40A
MADRKSNDDRYVDNNKGPYPDGDSRNITLTKSDNPIEPQRSGPAEDNYRDGGEAAASANAAKKAGTDDAGANGAVDPVDPDKKPVGETSEDPATRARADANRPLGA